MIYDGYGFLGGPLIPATTRGDGYTLRLATAQENPRDLFRFRGVTEDNDECWEIDVAVFTEEEWESVIEDNPRLASWGVARIGRGLVMAVRPLA